MHSPATPPGLANAADVLSGQLRVHLRKLFLLLRPQTAQIARRFRSWLRAHRYDARQVKALCGITPAAAAAMMDARTPAAFFEQVEYNGRRLAKLDVAPQQVIEALRHYDGLLDPALGRLPPAAARDLEWARSQLQFCIVLALNNAFYQVRETEAARLIKKILGRRKFLKVIARLDDRSVTSDRASYGYVRSCHHEPTNKTMSC